MSSLKRKLSRDKAKKEKKTVEKEMAAKVALFGKLPDKCLTCEEPFDKTDKQHVQNWNVVVRDAEEKVNLYCPECWNKAVNIIEDFKKHVEKGKNEQR
jgi:hypothetical protein